MLNSWLVALPDMWFRPDFTCPVTAFIRTLVYRIDSSSVVKRDGGWSPRVHAVATPLVAKVAKEMSRDCLRRCVTFRWQPKCDLASSSCAAGDSTRAKGES
jgi:hypothetical protein